MKERDVARRTQRADRLLRERIHDPYKSRRKLPDPARCPQCGAFYREGRWTWSEAPAEPLQEETCQACHRVNDQYPAGEVLLEGSHVAAHREEILNLARNVERTENAEHPLHRIMDVAEEGDRLVIRTTDIHLPRAIAHALERTWKGNLSVHYDEEGYYVRAKWRRDDGGQEAGAEP